MKIRIILGMVVLLAIVGCTNIQKVTDFNLEYVEQIPIIDGYYEGNKVWFIHPDVSNPDMAEKLTRMINYQTLYVPKHAEVVDIEKLAKLYVFSNGVDQKDTEPWGGGPFGFQIDIFDAIPGDKDYTALRRPHVVTWNDDARPRILKTEQDLLDAEAANELSIEAADFVVNVPIVRWPGGGLKLQ